MGDIADMYCDFPDEEYIAAHDGPPDFPRRHYTPRFFRPPEPTAPVWVTGQGERIPINKMEDSHVANTISYLTRRKDAWDRAIEVARESGVELGSMILGKLTIEQWLANFYAEVKRRQGGTQ